MKKLVVTLIIVGINSLIAQGFEYKKGILIIAGEEVAKISVTKEYIGFANTFEVFNMQDEKIIHAAYAADYEEDPDNNMDFYYLIDFISTKQQGIFYLSKLSTEKSLANLLGKNGVFENGELNESKINALIDSKGLNPKKIINYTTVNRNTSWPIELKAGGIIEQDGKVIGQFKDISKANNIDVYDFYLPTQVLIAKVQFTNGNNSQDCEMQTFKDNLKRKVQVPSSETVDVLITSGDRNEVVLKRIIKWMVANGYL